MRPCQKKKQSCTRKCRCFNCGNDNHAKGYCGKYTGNMPKQGCSCGTTMKTKVPNYKSCIDGDRKTKCPCVAGGVGCTDECQCYNCCNIFKRKEDKLIEGSVNQQTRKRRRTTVSPYKRKNSAEFMASQGVPITPGPWTELETICLMICQEIIRSHNLDTSFPNIGKLFRFISQSNKVKHMSLCLGSKSNAQIAAKIGWLKSSFPN